MHPEARELVVATWRQIEPASEAGAALFYERLFTLDPELRPLFDEADMGAQRRMLAQALGMAVRAADDLDAIRPALEALGRRHAGYGVEASHYDTVGAALLWTLEQGLGEAWTDAARAAWAELYAAVATVMREAGSG